jgi:molybdenum cofactor biosynthesis enzyme MoaA
MGPTGSDIRVLQIHPSLRCNLRCQHCYSSSGPQARASLSAEQLRAAICDARAEGYNVVGVSGGEPLLFEPLPEVLAEARALGMVTTVTTNGMLLSDRKIASLQPVVDLIAISLDGTPESHNRMRGAPRAFELMQGRLAGLREAGIPFGFIFTLTIHNLDELDQVAAFAVEQGARLLQVHPLEEVGRAQEQLPSFAPDALELAYAFLEVARLQAQYAGTLQIQFDVADRDVIVEQPERVFALQPRTGDAERPLSELVAPLILQADGALVPLQYGVGATYHVGNIADGRLRTHAARWRAERYGAFLELCRAVYARLLSSTSAELPFANWYGALAEASRAAAL